MMFTFHHIGRPDDCQRWCNSDLCGRKKVMMSYEWFPWYPALYRADTMHLTPEQDGIYRRLIDHYMETRQPLPDNDCALVRISGCTIDAWAMAAAIIRPFFRHSADGLLHHKRCDAILHEQDGRNRKQSEKGKKGAESRWKNKHIKQELNSSGHTCSIATPIPENATRHDMTRQDNNTHTEKSRGEFLIASWVPQPEFSNYLEMREENFKSKDTRSTVSALISTLQMWELQGADIAQVLRDATIGKWATLHLDSLTKSQRQSKGRINGKGTSKSGYSDIISAGIQANAQGGKSETIDSYGQSDFERLEYTSDYQENL